MCSRTVLGVARYFAAGGKIAYLRILKNDLISSITLLFVDLRIVSRYALIAFRRAILSLHYVGIRLKLRSNYISNEIRISTRLAGYATHSAHLVATPEYGDATTRSAECHDKVTRFDINEFMYKN